MVLVALGGVPGTQHPQTYPFEQGENLEGLHTTVLSLLRTPLSHSLGAQVVVGDENGVITCFGMKKGEVMPARPSRPLLR